MVVRQTSLTAYQNTILPNINKKQQKIHECLQLFPEGLTNTEIATCLQTPINCVTPRTNELNKKGLIKEGATRKCTITGHTATTWLINQHNN